MATTTLRAEMKEKESKASDSAASDKDGDEKGRRGGGFHRKKVCRFCSDQDYVVDYKDVRLMQSFVTEHGKLVARRISGTCAKHQRFLTSAVKRARNLALIGYVNPGHFGN